MSDEIKTHKSDATLSEDLVRIGAEHTAYGLVVGIILTVAFLLGGIFCLVLAYASFTDPQFKDETGQNFAWLGTGTFLTLLSSYLLWSQSKMRTQIQSALKK